MTHKLNSFQLTKRGKVIALMLNDIDVKSLEDFMNNSGCCRKLNAACASSMKNSTISRFFVGAIKATQNQNLTMEKCNKFLNLLTKL